MQVISNINNHPCSQWILIIEGIEQPVIFTSYGGVTIASKWAYNYIEDNFTVKPNWICMSKVYFKEQKWTYNKLDGRWCRCTDFTKGTKVSFKSNKQFKTK